MEAGRWQGGTEDRVEGGPGDGPGGAGRQVGRRASWGVGPVSWLGGVVGREDSEE